MATRVSHKSLLLTLVLIFFISCPTKARRLGEIVKSRMLLVVEKDQETRNSSRHEGGASDSDGWVDMDYNSANKKRPIHNR
ncbi:unnamed protein product [Cochlearia groenlandica]